MQFSCKAGDTALINDRGGIHRYVVLTNRNNNTVVVVNFTKADNCPDKTVLFTSTDDRYLFPYPTRVFYKKASVVTADWLMKEVNRNDEVSAYRLCPDHIFGRIIEGAFKSEHTVFEIKEELGLYYPEKFEFYFPDGLTA